MPRRVSHTSSGLACCPSPRVVANNVCQFA
jgi:hypothetical protein